MAGSRKGGVKASQIMKEKYGEDYYRELGRRGGKITGAFKGFSVYPDKAKKVWQDRRQEKQAGLQMAERFRWV